MKTNLTIQRILCSLIFSILCLIFFNSCTKTDISTVEKPLSDQFFSLPKNSPLALQRVATTLKVLEVKTPFIERFTLMNGFPKWDKAIISNINQSYQRRGVSDSVYSDTLIIIPLVNADSLWVSGFISAKLNGDVSFSLYRGADYHFYSFDSSQVRDSIDADKAALQLMLLNKKVFGYTFFKVNDARLFDDVHTDTSVKYIKLNSISSDGQSDIFGRETSEICYTVSLPAYCETGRFKADSNNISETNMHIPFNCIFSYTVCNQMPTIDDIPIYPFPTGGGGGGGGGGGQSPNDIFPCPNLQGRNAPPLCAPPGPIIILPIEDEPIIYDEVWFNNLSPFTLDLSALNAHPCVKQIAGQVIALTNSTISTISSLFQESSKFNLKIIVDATLPSNIVGRTTPVPAYNVVNGMYGDLVYLNTTIKLNPLYLSGTKMSIAQTIIHEMIHAYFNYRSIDAVGNPTKLAALAQELGFLKPYDPNTPPADYGNQHEQMAASYIDKIVLALKEYKLISAADLIPLQNMYPGLDIETYYKAMAWSGLNGAINGVSTIGWETFKTNNSTAAQMYEVIASTETLGTELAPSKDKCD